MLATRMSILAMFQEIHRWIFVQSGQYETLRGKLEVLAAALADFNAGIITGAKSLISRELQQSGARVIRLSFGDDDFDDVGAILGMRKSVDDFREQDQDSILMAIPTKTLAWSLRLAAFLNASAALFLPGEIGMLAHFIPFLAFVVKSEIKKGKSPRRIVLLGWSESQLKIAYGILEQFAGISPEEAKSWFRSYSVDQIQEAVRFLAGIDK